MEREEDLVVLHHEGHDDTVAATLTVGGARGLDIYALLERLRSATPTGGAATSVSLDLGGGLTAVFGGAFVYATPRNDPPALPVSGQVERLQLFDNGAPAADVQGLTASAAGLFGFLRAGDLAGAGEILFGSSDRMTGSPSGDWLMGYAGNDRIDGGGGADSLDGGAGADDLAGGTGNDFIRGLADDDVIDGGEGDDDVNGNTGADVVRGGDGADVVRGGQDNDYIFGGAGDDPHLNGNLGDDEVFGGDGRDTVFGGQGADMLFGEAGDDALSGDLGDDVLTGGAGADRFLVRAGGGLDRVADFNGADGDRVQLAPGTGYTIATLNADAAITLADGARLVLTGVAPGALGDWLVFA